jgi:hypothetical protein
MKYQVQIFRFLPVILSWECLSALAYGSKFPAHVMSSSHRIGGGGGGGGGGRGVIHISLFNSHPY